MKGNWSLVLLGVVVVLSLATMPGCKQVSNLNCQDAHYAVVPGQSVELRNPCPNTQTGIIDGLWQDTGGDYFATGVCNSPLLPGPVNGITLTSMPDPKSPSQRQRFLVADSTAPPVVDLNVCYIYASSFGFFGKGKLFVTTSAPLTVSATANPTTVAAGNTSQLNAIVTGGVPPYSFAWSPTPSLSDSTLANPVAKPATTTTYTVTVTDSGGGQSASAMVTVRVGLTVSATANPTPVAAGQASQLTAFVTGGVPPYSFAWSPTASLSDPTLFDPVAKPTTTTTYTVTVTDSTLPKGQTSSATTTLTVSAPASFILTVVNTNPDALGGVSDNQGLITSCFATTCSAAYPSGTTVVLATGPGAPPNWSGCNSVDSTKHCTVVMDAAKKVTVSP